MSQLPLSSLLGGDFSDLVKVFADEALTRVVQRGGVNLLLSLLDSSDRGVQLTSLEVLARMATLGETSNQLFFFAPSSCASCHRQMLLNPSFKTAMLLSAHSMHVLRLSPERLPTNVQRWHRNSVSHWNPALP